MLSWNYVAYSLTLVIYFLQQIGFDYHLINSHLPFVFVVAFDLIVLAALVMNHRADYAASKGSSCWVLYTWVTLFKIVMVYFVINNYIRENVGIIMKRGSLEITILWYITPVIYALLSFRSYDELFGGVKDISTESMLHGDLVLHVVLDFWDLGAACFEFVSLPEIIEVSYSWLQITVGVIISAAFFLHGYSFPSVGNRDESSTFISMDAGDVFITRKHAAFVGICFIDVPLLVFRFFMWTCFPSFIGLSPFVVKNILCMLVQCHRLRQATAAARMRTLRQQRKTAMLQNAKKDVMVAAYGGNRRGASISPRAVMKYVRIKEERDDEEGGSSSMAEKGGDREGRGDGGDKGENREEAIDDVYANWRMSRTDQLEELRRVRQIVKNARAPRRLPVEPTRSGKVIEKMLQCLRSGGGRHGLALLLDSVLRLGYWRQLRLAFPPMLIWLSQIAIVAILFSIYDRENPLFPIQYFSIGGFYKVSYLEIPLDLRLCFYVVGGCLIWSVICWVCTAPFFDVVFACLFSPLQLMSFTLMVMSFRDFAVFDDAFLFRSNGIDDNMALYFIWIFALEPIIGVLYILYPFLCALLDKEYMGYVVTPSRSTFFSRVKTAANLNYGGDSSSKSSTGETEYADAAQPKRGDEFGVMTTTSFVVFLNCRFALAPINIHELLIGPDLIKAVNLNDVMLQAHLRTICLTFLTRLWCVSLFWSFPSSIAYGKNVDLKDKILSVYRITSLSNYFNFAVAVLLFIIHVVLLFYYMIFSQIVRLLSLRKYEVKSMFEDLVDVWSRKSGITSPYKRLSLERSRTEGPLSEEVRGRDLKRDGNRSLTEEIERNRMIIAEEIVEVQEKYQRQSTFTYPGEILPNVL